MSTRVTRSSQKSNIIAGSNNVSKAIVQNENSKRRLRERSESNKEPSETVIEVTPPKQGRFSRKPNSLYSPSTLLSRLSIEGRSDDSETEIEFIAPPKSNIANARKVLNIAETDNLYGREKELDELTAFFENNLKNGTSASMYVSGQPGTGKTACISKLLKSKFSQKFKKVYINCTSLQTPSTIYKAIVTELGIKLASDKETNLRSIEKYLSTNKKMVLLVLDEIDELVEKKQSVLYTIFEWPALPKSKLILVGIANSLDLTNRALSRLQANSELKPKLMHFAPYTKQQIVDIFKSRLEVAGVLDVFPMATIQLLSAKVAAMSGDVRKALDIGRRVAEIAGNEKKSSLHGINLEELGISELDSEPVQQKVEIKQVLNVLNSVYSTARTLDDDLTDSFPLQQKVLVCTLLLMLNNGKNKDITVGRLHAIYVKVCIKRGIPSVHESEFLGMCALTETKGIIRVIKNKVSRLSKIQLQWDQEEITEAVKDKQLIADILGDKSCLFN